MSEEKALEGELVRAKNGQFVKGSSGGPGRPKGSKNQITLLKAAMEENFRESTAEKVAQVLEEIVEAALQGDAQARKMVWDAHISKATHQEDKTAGSKQAITVHRMTVTQERNKEESSDETAS